MWKRTFDTLPNKIVLPVAMIGALVLGVAADRIFFAPKSPKVTAEKADLDSPGQELKLNEKRIQAAHITLARVTAGSLSDQIIAQATVAATPDGAAIIGARADGTVTAIRKRLGDTVARGESIGAIQSREAARMAEDRAAAQARLVRAQQAFERQRNLLGANATSRQDYDTAQSEWKVAQAELKRTISSGSASGLSSDGVSLDILSPIAGRITAAPAMLGAYVVAGTELFRVADPAKLEIQVAVPSSDAQRIVVGDKATLDLPQGLITALVRAITPDINLQSRAATVVLSPQGNARGLQPGQLVSVRISVARAASASGAMLIPTEALQKIGGDDAVFVRTDDGFRVRSVVPGTESGDMTEIRSGLKSGEEIASGNAFLLKAELQKDSAGDAD